MKVDTEPIEFCATKQLPLRSNSALHDVHPSFAYFLRGILEVGYERFRVCDQNVENSEPAMNDPSVVYPFHHVDDVQPLTAPTLEWVRSDYWLKRGAHLKENGMSPWLSYIERMGLPQYSRIKHPNSWSSDGLKK